MSIYLSPGVYVREVDLSLYVPNLSTTSFGVVGLASKGPLNTPIFVSDTVQFANTFGDPSEADTLYGPYAALQYLSQGRQLWYVRVSSTDTNGNPLADSAALTLNEKVTAAFNVSTKTGSISLTAGSNNTLVFQFDGSSVASGTVGYVSVTVPITAVGNTQTFTMQNIAAYLNSDAGFSYWATASVTADGKLLITRNVDGSNHKILCDSGVLTTAATSGGFGFNPAAQVGTGVNLGAPQLRSKVFSSGLLPTLTAHWTGASPAIRLKYKFRPAKGSYITVTGSGPYTVTLTGDTWPTDIVNADPLGASTKNVIYDTVNSNASYSVTTRNSDTQITVTGVVATAPFTLAWGTFDFIYTVDVPFSAWTDGVTTVDTFVQSLRANAIFTEHFLVGTQVASGATFFFVTPTRHSGSASTINVVDVGTAALYADTTDVYINDLLFGVSASTNVVAGTSPTEVLAFSAVSEGTWGNGISIATTDAGSGNFNLFVYNKGNLIERFMGLNRTTPTVAIDALGTPGPNPLYVENAVNGNSTLVTVTDLLKNLVAFNAYGPQLISLATPKNLANGTNGVPVSDDVSAYIGSVSGGTATGLQIFGNPEQQDVNLLAVPGVSDAAVINSMISICESRKDCMCIVDTPKGLTPQQAVDWHNGKGVFADHQAFNSSYAALYWPWLQIYDPINKVKIWTPPSGHVAAAYAFSDYSTQPWYAPAGLTRGHLTAPIAAQYNPTLGERDLLYGNGNAVNPIATFLQNGINIWGQRTLQRAPTALDRVNVRRLMLYLEKVISTATRYLLFQPNNASTWIQFVDLVTPILDGVQARQGLTGYQVRCDASTNTKDVIEQNQMNALIFVKPTKTAEMIQLTMVLTAQGASFSEIVF